MGLKKDLVLGIAALIVLSTISIGLGSADLAEMSGSEDLSSEGSEEVLSEDLKERISSKTSDEKVEVVIRLTPYEFDDREPLETPLSEVDTDGVVEELKEHAERKQSEVIEHLHRNGGEVINTFWIANAVLAEVDVETLNVLAGREDVWKIHENFEVGTHDYTDSLGSDDLDRHVKESFRDLTELDSEADRPDPLPSKEHERRSFSHTRSEPSGELTWGLDRINAADVWEEGFDGSGVRVAVSDTGVDIDHPDLQEKMVDVEDDQYYTGGWIEFDEDGNIVENSVPHDNHGHGSHVSGTVVGGNASGTHIGVAPSAELMHALVLPEGGGTLTQVLAGLEWKVEPHDRFGNTLEPVEEYRADVASMSWGAGGYHEEREEPIENMVDAGIVPVASIGNSGEGRVGSPGAIYEAFGIGASDEEDEIADFSSGAIVEDEREDTPDEYVKPDFAAPGVDVKSAVPGEGWEYNRGTSMAAPHVAGTAALMLGANSHLSIENIYHTLQITADLFDEGESLPNEDKNTRYGHGIIDAYRSVSAVMKNLTLRRAENISRYEGTLRGEVLDMPDEEMEVFFRYREEGEEEWSDSEPMTVTEPQIFESKIDGLEKATTYEYKAVGLIEGEEENTFSLTFTTHDDVELSSLTPANITEESALLRGEVAELYLENVSVLFRYRERDGDLWNETDVLTITEPSTFEYELGPEKLEDIFVCEYKAVAFSEEREFLGEKLRFPTGAVEPEWDKDEEAYLITNVGELQWIENDLEAEYILQNDIDASWTENWPGGRGFRPIGNHSHRFNGSFEGEDHKIEDLYVFRPYEKHVGLFSFVGREGIIKNTELDDVFIRGYEYGGGLIGENHGQANANFVGGIIEGFMIMGGVAGHNFGTISDSSVDIERIRVVGFAGGLVGVNEEMINGSDAAGLVHGAMEAGTERIGGVAAVNNGTVHDCSFSGAIYGSGLDATEDDAVGGLIGINNGNITDSNSTVYYGVGYQGYTGGVAGINRGEIVDSNARGEAFSYGRWSGDDTGGLVGTNEGKVKRSYADFYVAGRDVSVGGLVGDNRGEVKYSYALGGVEGYPCLGGLVGTNRGIVNYSYAVGDVKERTDRGEGLGGLIGDNRGKVKGSYALGDVEGNSSRAGIGGLIGINGNFILNETGYLNQSYSAGRVLGDGDGGGLVGRSEQSDIRASYWDMGRSDKYESEGGTGLLTTEMIGAETIDNMETFDFDRIWETVNRDHDDVKYESYPILRSMDRERQIANKEIYLETTVNTLPVEDKNLDSAVLRGEVHSIGSTEEVDVYFHWREEGDEGWNEINVETINGSGKFEHRLENLTLGRSYQYYAYAGGEVSTEGYIQTFKTTEAPTIKTLEVRDITHHSSIFQGELIEMGTAETVNVSFQYRKKNNQEEWMKTSSLSLKEPTEFEIKVITLSPDTIYEFRARGIGDERDHGETLNFTTEMFSTYDLTIESTQGGEVMEPGEGTMEVDKGGEVTLEAVSEEKHHFVRWRGDNETIVDPYDESTTIEMLDDYTIIAEFTIDVYSLAIDSTSGGEVIYPGEGGFEYEAGGVVDIRASADEGYHFVEWSGDSEFIKDPTSKQTSIEISENHTITAEFEVDSYQLTIDSTEGGEVVGPGEGAMEFDKYSVVTLEAAADEYHHFVEWTGDTDVIEDPTSEETTIEMLDDHTITAEFELDEYELNLNVEGKGSTEPGEGSHTYDHGEEVTVEAAPGDGWVFSHWSGDVAGEEEEITIIIDGDKDITAHFVEEAHFEIEVTTPEEEFEKGEVVFEYTVRNTGGVEDTRTVEFTIDGVVEAGEEVTL